MTTFDTKNLVFSKNPITLIFSLIMLLQFEVFFANTSFVVLFITMFYYWYQLSSSFTTSLTNIKPPTGSFARAECSISSTPTENTNSLARTEFIPPAAVSTSFMGMEKQPTSHTGVQNSNFISFPTITFIISFCSLLLLLILRWKEFGHFPLSNLYESLIFLCLCCLLIHFFTQNLLFGLDKTGLSVMTSFFGSITSSSALCINAFASFSLPDEMQHGSSLVPALQSNWLMMHVTVMITSYAALIIGSLFSIAYLVVDQYVSSQPRASTLTYTLTTSLDNLSYRVIGLGFPLLTIGILSGAVWANEAWGSYWSWDPKETWALLTWLIFAIYLHTRITRGWSGRQSAIMASLGFVTVWVCFLGVNLLGEGLHSYGFLTK